MTFKNVIFLTVDALRADHLGRSVGGCKTTPTLDFFVENGFSCNTAYSLAPSTQASFPSIFTSSAPLSYGGYDEGVVRRPNLLSRVLSDNGYEVIHLPTFPWVTDSYGYEDGVDSSILMFDICNLVGAFAKTISNTSKAYRDGTLNIDSYVSIVLPRALRCLKAIKDYCGKNLEATHLTKARTGALGYPYNFSEIIRFIERERSNLERDPANYILRHLSNLPVHASQSWIGAELRLLVTGKNRIQAKVGIFQERLARSIRSRSSRVRSLWKNKSFVDGSELCDLVIDSIRSAAVGDRPFYLWTHFMDTHAPYVPGGLDDWPRCSHRLLDRATPPDLEELSTLFSRYPINQNDADIWRLAYMASVKYVDEQILKIVSETRRLGIYDSCLFVVCGDHGEELGEHGEWGHRFRFYEECVNVPIVFYSSDLGHQAIRGLTDLTDVAPTLLDILGIKSPETFEGKSLTSGDSSRKYIQMECFHRGNCDFQNKPIYGAVRDKRYKYIFREWIDDDDTESMPFEEFYDLEKDAAERFNIIDSVAPDLIASFRRIRSERLRIVKGR